MESTPDFFSTLPWQTDKLRYLFPTHSLYVSRGTITAKQVLVALHKTLLLVLYFFQFQQTQLYASFIHQIPQKQENK